MPVFRFVIRFTIAAVFIGFAIAKLWPGHAHPLTDTRTLYGTILPTQALQSSVAISEIVLGLWLLTGFFPRCALLVSMFILAVFTGVLLAEIPRQHPKPCGCAGSIASPQEERQIRVGLGLGAARNFALLAGSLFLFAGLTRKKDTGFPVLPDNSTYPDLI